MLCEASSGALTLRLRADRERAIPGRHGGVGPQVTPRSWTCPRGPRQACSAQDDSFQTLFVQPVLATLGKVLIEVVLGTDNEISPSKRALRR